MELPTGQAGRTNPPRPTRPLQTASLATFRGDALTDLLAGLAANSIGSFVKGFTPLRASVAGLFTTDILTKPGMTNSPDSFSSLVSVRRVRDSDESSVIQEWWPDSKRSHQCGRTRTAPVTTAASCGIRAI